MGILQTMHEFMACALATHRPRLLRRWEEALRALPPSSGLAHPDTLVHLMPPTLDRIVKALAAGPHPPEEHPPVDCACGMNPLVTFFITAESALIDSLFIAEPAWAKLQASQRETGLGTLRATLRSIADDDIEAFCSLCQMRQQARIDCKPAPAQRAISARRWGGSVRGRPLVPRP